MSFYKLGIDVGSTTVKVVLLDQENKIIFSVYERHMSNIFAKATELLDGLHNQVGNLTVRPIITGSGGLSLTKVLNIPFEQEVITCSKAIETFIPETDVAIELGGEDAKITFFEGSIEQRMNGTCAGGTGAFIDQMAILLDTDATGLNELAKKHNIIYPIAARCGVFAKTDIQPLINEGAKKEDLAASIFQAVVNQTISGLACGRQIKGNIAFLGGPLNFLSELRKRFIETLKIKDENLFFPENSQYYVAMGAALLSDKSEPIELNKIIEKISKSQHSNENTSEYLEPLFANQGEYDEFLYRHGKNAVTRTSIKSAKGKLFLGIDAGSTTTKGALIDELGRLVYLFYENNNGNPLETVRKMLLEIYSLLDENQIDGQSKIIGRSTVTGYGESLIKAAFSVDNGEIETMAHFKAADYFLPGVNFILDIGGQDMKCMQVSNGVIQNIMLNEACSSGCGSFLETYAKSMNIDVITFAKEAIFAPRPVDLGTRCTVFMNSKVKQAQKEGVTIGEISAGLSYSVIKNALYKVIKLRDVGEAGDKVVVQGGTFLNNAVLRSIEKVMGKEVVRPDISGNMGAYGAALLSKEGYMEDDVSTIANKEELENFITVASSARCNRCENRCLLTINKFSSGKKFTTGNRCEIGAGLEKAHDDTYNLFAYKYKRLFDYIPLEEAEATRGKIGIPRVLNMYENYPFWFRLFTQLGYEVVLSPQSSKPIYESGMESISSDTACYPAKLVHGHIKWLVNNGVKEIFYPSINHENMEDENATNHYNCPVVATYPEVIANNMDDIFADNGVTFHHPFLPYDDKEKLTRRMYEEMQGAGISYDEINDAVMAAVEENEHFKNDVHRQALRIIKYVRRNGKKAVVLAGRPYHLDPEINHGLDKLITSFGMAVLTEDSISHLAKPEGKLRVLDQWMYHSRLYKAASLVGRYKELEMIQLTSFGCGLDAVTTDQVEEILRPKNKLYTLIKIDEGNNLGAAKIRIRSLKAAMEAQEKNPNLFKIQHKSTDFEHVQFTEQMKKDYTILCPQMSPMHFQFLESAMQSEGYNLVLLPSVDKNAVEEGLKHINNDACFPTIVALGQVIEALKSGKYDINKVAVVLSQTGGGCRASNYIALLRKALIELKMEHIPVISANYVGLEKHPGFKITFSLAKKFILGLLYGDVFMQVLYATRPYEKVAGSANALFEQWSEKINVEIQKPTLRAFRRNIKAIISDFEKLEKTGAKKPKVGVVGEILVKYHPTANNDIVSIIEREGGEAVVPGLTDFFLYGMYSKEYNYLHLSGSYKVMASNKIGIAVMEGLRNIARKAYRNSEKFEAPLRINELAEKAKRIVSLGNQCGEGWLLTGEMIELMDTGVTNIVCLQPFACLPNHVTGKGMIKALRKYNNRSNIAAIDYDPGASEVNQLNRIKLMMATAFKNLEK